MYKFITQDNKYENCNYVETKMFEKIEIPDLSFTPFEMKLFSNDVFNFIDGNCELIHSNFKSNKYNPGILDLTMTYGKHKNKFLYLCKPDDKRIPFFLIPYNIPYSYDKSIQKIYITFEFLNWDNEYPYGIITQNLGSINVLNNFYEYILYCKSLNISIQKFTKDAKEKLENKTNDEIIQSICNNNNIKTIEKKDEFVFTIDSKNTNDLDDAISYNFRENKISVYITNVAIVMDHLNLWNSFSNRISSIYLPDKKRSMIPNILANCLCSLKEKQNKLCYILDIYYNESGNIINHEFKIAKVYISKNFNYENPETYQNNKYFKKITELLKIKNSREVVTKLMLYFNNFSAKTLSKYKKGIYKSLNQNEIIYEDKPEHMPNTIYEHINILKNQASSYCLYEENYKYISQTNKDFNIYLQLTSPIRRLVDVLNNIVLLDCLNLYKVSDNGIQFYNNWTSNHKLDFMNTSFRAIRKIQSKCKIYDTYHKLKDKNIIYEGYVFDKIKKEGDGKYQYMVYIEKLQLTSYITLLDDLDNYSRHMFSLYVFMSEENDKNKIKLQIIFEE